MGSSAVDFGCDYCRDDGNRLFGRVTQIGSDEQRRMLLLRCPRCGTLYENSARGPDLTRRLSGSEAEKLFPRLHATPEMTAPESAACRRRFRLVADPGSPGATFAFGCR